MNLEVSEINKQQRADPIFSSDEVSSDWKFEFWFIHNIFLKVCSFIKKLNVFLNLKRVNKYI